MKIGIKSMGEEIFFYICYEEGEWELLEQKFKELGLEQATISNGWGAGMSLRVWREQDSGMLTRLISETINRDLFIDNINAPFFRNGVWNLAIFRVIPEDGKVWVPLREVPTILDLKEFLRAYKELIKVLLRTALNVEISIKWKVKKISLEEERGREDEIQT